MTCIKSKNVFTIIVLIITIAFLVYSLMFLLNCMVEYKYHIDQNFDYADLCYTYSERKWELKELMYYLNFCIAYSTFVFIYFVYRMCKQCKINGRFTLNAVILIEETPWQKCQGVFFRFEQGYIQDIVQFDKIGFASEMLK